MSERDEALSPSLLPVELCLGTSWEEPRELFYGRFIAVPRIGETVVLPHRPHQALTVADVRHCSATPAGDRPRIRILLSWSDR